MHAIDLSELEPQYMSDEITLVDFNQAFSVSDQDPYLQPAVNRLSPAHLAPEMFAGRRPTEKSDLWALATTIFFMRSGDLMLGCEDLKFIYGNFIRYLGPPLPDTRLKLRTGDFYKVEYQLPKFNPDALLNDVKKIGNNPAAKRSIIRCKKRFESNSPFNIPHNPISDDEAILLTNLLSKLLKYVPEERVAAKDLVTHPWFAFDEGS